MSVIICQMKWNEIQDNLYHIDDFFLFGANGKKLAEKHQIAVLVVSF